MKTFLVIEIMECYNSDSQPFSENDILKVIHWLRHWATLSFKESYSHNYVSNDD